MWRGAPALLALLLLVLLLLCGKGASAQNTTVSNCLQASNTSFVKGGQQYAAFSCTTSTSGNFLQANVSAGVSDAFSVRVYDATNFATFQAGRAATCLNPSCTTRSSALSLSLLWTTTGTKYLVAYCEEVVTTGSCSFVMNYNLNQLPATPAPPTPLPSTTRPPTPSPTPTSNCGSFVTCSTCSNQPACAWTTASSYCFDINSVPGSVSPYSIVYTPAYCPGGSASCPYSSCLNCLGAATSCLWSYTTNICYISGNVPPVYSSSIVNSSAGCSAQAANCNQYSACSTCAGAVAGSCVWSTSSRVCYNTNSVPSSVPGSSIITFSGNCPTTGSNSGGGGGGIPFYVWIIVAIVVLVILCCVVGCVIRCCRRSSSGSGAVSPPRAADSIRITPTPMPAPAPPANGPRMVFDAATGEFVPAGSAAPAPVPPPGPVPAVFDPPSGMFKPAAAAAPARAPAFNPATGNIE